MPPAPVSTARKEETCILIGLIHKHQNENLVTEYLDELAFLAETAGAKTLRRFTQRMESPDSKTFIGTGKLQEIAAYIKTNAVDLAIFDDELRARTAQAKAQVELAQYQYLLPRLTRMWTHLEKQRGGIGMRGPGESEIETDRRVIRDKLAKLKGKLRDFEKQSATQRKQRSEMIRVALVGYTNVGKSTLMNLLSKSEVFAENKLFATLDTTVRKIVYDRVPFLLSDTVGFIRKLPHDLIESFKSTLDEVREADILIHVVDISHPQFEDHIHVVNQTLVDIGATDKPTILVFNKIDAYHYIPKEEDDLTPATRENMSLEDLKKSWISNIQGTCIFISAVNRTNVEELRLKLTEMVKELHFVRYPNYLDNDSSSGE